jgi:CRISPR-associated protein Csb2
MITDKPRALVVDVNLLDEFWHGFGDWPPSPFRAYQALIAGAYGGRWQAEDVAGANDSAFLWLEKLGPPVVLAPFKRDAPAIRYYVPNNDLDAVGNDPRRSGKIRIERLFPRISLNGEPRFTFIWFFDDGESHAQRVVDLCDRFHHFGRGLDPAYAIGSVVAAATLNERIARHEGSIARPSIGTDGTPGPTILPCPTPGSLDSLRIRFAETAHRFSQGRQRKGTLFQQPPKSLSQLVAYDRPPRRLILELRELGTFGAFCPIRVEHATRITKAVRNLAFDRLKGVLDEIVVEKLILGRGATDAEKGQRVRFIPIPSVGSRFTDPSIRRVVVEMPADCPILEEDMRWALASQRVPDVGLLDPTSGEVRGAQLLEAIGGEMLWQYGLRGTGARRWQTVTPAVLPVKRFSGKMSGSERVAFEQRLVSRVLDALRHADVQARPTAVDVQREPFYGRGVRADAFEPDRFERGHLYHVEIEFEDALGGPLTLGDGRWLGLGLMRPIRDSARAADVSNVEPAVAESADDQDEDRDSGEEA